MNEYTNVIMLLFLAENEGEEDEVQRNDRDDGEGEHRWENHRDDGEGDDRWENNRGSGEHDDRLGHDWDDGPRLGTSSGAWVWQTTRRGIPFTGSFWETWYSIFRYNNHNNTSTV